MIRKVAKVIALIVTAFIIGHALGVASSMYYAVASAPAGSDVCVLPMGLYVGCFSPANVGGAFGSAAIMAVVVLTVEEFFCLGILGALLGFIEERVALYKARCQK